MVKGRRHHYGNIWLLSSEKVEEILSYLKLSIVLYCFVVLSCLVLSRKKGINLILSWSSEERVKRFHGVGAAYEILVLRTPVRFWVGPFLCRSGVGRGIWVGNRLYRMLNHRKKITLMSVGIKEKHLGQ